VFEPKSGSLQVVEQAFFGQRGFGFATTSSGACRLEAAGGLGWFEFSSPTAVAMSGRGRKRGPGGEPGPSQNKDLGEELRTEGSRRLRRGQALKRCDRIADDRPAPRAV